MDAQTLANAMLNTLPLARYAALRPAFEDALRRSQCNTVARCAMFIAQVGTESGGLQWMEELASGAEYEGRADLGNTQPGDGVRFKGRGPIQVTGRANYTNLSEWAASLGYVISPTYFVDHPEELSSDTYGFLGAIWYWTVARNMNSFADAMDINGATRAVNGGLNGLADRTQRWNVALRFGNALLPGDDMATTFKNFEGNVVDEATFMYWVDMRVKQILDQLAGDGRNQDGTAAFTGWPQLGGRTVVDALAVIGQKLGIEGFGKVEGNEG